MYPLHKVIRSSCSMALGDLSLPTASWLTPSRSQSRHLAKMSWKKQQKEACCFVGPGNRIGHVLYCGVIRIFLFNGFSSVFHSCPELGCSVTVPTKWMTPPKMVYNWYRV